MTWTPRQHSAALRHRAWHRVPEPRPKRYPPAWELRGLTWTRPRDNDDGCVAWVMPAGWPERWFGFVSRYPEAGLPVGQHDTAEQAKAAVDAQLRLEGWDT